MGILFPTCSFSFWVCCSVEMQGGKGKMGGLDGWCDGGCVVFMSDGRVEGERVRGSCGGLGIWE